MDIFEQLDLYLALKNIGACWYGLGKTDEMKFENLDFIIMIAIEEGKESEFRKNYLKVTRKEIEVIWKSNLKIEIGEIVKYSPSICSNQPWRISCINNILQIYNLFLNHLCQLINFLFIIQLI